MVEAGEKPFITLWCPLTYKKKRQINLPTDKEIYADKFTAVAFTFDSKYILCVTGEPDWMLYAFKCDKGKLESTARANNIGNTGYVRQVSGTGKIVVSCSHKRVVDRVQSQRCQSDCSDWRWSH